MMSYRQWFVLLVIYMIFMLVGSIVFIELEIDNELADRQDLYDLKKRVIDVVSNLENDSRSDVEEVVQEMSDNCKHDFLDLDEDEPLTWSLWNSFFFTFTVITTIGFGHMSPSTPWGKGFCIIYATIGVPLNGILIASLADLFSSKIVNSRVRAKAERYESWVGVAADAILYLLPGFLVFLVVPAAIIVMVEEGWNYLDSFYYAFITLTTIGFGDYVAGQQKMDLAEVWLYKIASFIWIIFGLGYIIMIITFIQKALKSKKIHNIERHLARALKSQATKINVNFHNDVKRLRNIVNAMSVRGVEPIYPKGEDQDDNGDRIKRATSHPTLSPESRHDSKSSERVFLSHHHTPKHLKRKLKKNERSKSDEALNSTDKAETFSQLNPLGNVNVFLDMVESLLKEHETDAAKSAEDDARQIIQDTMHSDLSSDSASEEEPKHTNNTQKADVETGYLNKGYIDDDDKAIYDLKKDNLPKENIKSDENLRDRLHRKISTMLGVPDLQQSTSQTKAPSVEKTKTAGELLGMMEFIVCQPWSENRQKLQDFPSNTHYPVSQSSKFSRQFSSSVPGHYRSSTEDGRPHLLDVFQISTPETPTGGGPLRQDSSSSTQDTFVSSGSSVCRRRWSFGCDPSLQMRHYHQQQSDPGDDELFQETKDPKNGVFRLMPKWIQSDKDKESKDSSEEDNAPEYTRL